MFPHRILENEVADNGVRDRITACRKRLRESRAMTRVQSGAGVEEVFPETETARLRIRTLSGRNSSRERPSLLALEEEVGIT
jgi:hypothetical protein